MACDMVTGSKFYLVKSFLGDYIYITENNGYTIDFEMGLEESYLLCYSV